jgi:UPF0716 protein FxsA
VLALLALVFIVVPLVELYVIVQVGQEIGVLATILLLFVVSIVGAWLARHEGFVVFQRVRERVERGEVPGKELVDGMLVMLGGVLLLSPGFVTDVVGILLLFPPTRVAARTFLRRRFRVQVLGGPPGPGSSGSSGGPPRDRDDVIDL